MRRIFTILLACLASAVAPSTVLALYSVTPLPEDFEANCINNQDEVFGTLGSFPSAAVAVWRNGVVETLPMLAGHQLQAVRDCNDRGQVLGWTFLSNGGPASRVLWTDGVPEEVPELHIGNDGRPLNNLGDGVMIEFQPTLRSGIWNAGGSFTPITQAVGNPDSTTPYGINDDRLVVGTAQGLVVVSGVGQSQDLPFLWQDGQASALPLPSLSGHASKGATSLFINNAGEVFARGKFIKNDRSDQTERLIYWSGGNVVNLGFPGPMADGSIVPRDLNNGGVVVGWTTFGGAFMADPSGILEIEIDPRDPAAVDPSQYAAVSINDAGKILLAGAGSFLLTPGEDPHRWVNAAGGSWDDPANWEPAEVPGADDIAVFELAGSYDITFPAGVAAGAPRGTAASCAATRPVRATRVRAGEITYAGTVDLSTLSDAPASPGFRVGGEDDDDDPRVFLEGGELCSVFATVGDQSVDGTAEVAILGGTWRNEARLRVGDLGDGLLQIAGGEVIAAETRVGEIGGGEIVLDGVAELDTGALLVGAPALEAGHGAKVRVVSGTARSGTTLVGAALGVCFDAFGATDIPCATDRDCESVEEGACARNQSLELEGGTWSAAGPVFVGGGTILNDPGVPVDAPGSGALIVTGGVASMPALTLGIDSVGSGDRPATVSLGTAEVSGSLEVKGDVRVGAGGVGVLEVMGEGRADVDGMTTVGLPGARLPIGFLPDPDRFDVPVRVLHGLLEVDAAPSQVAFQTQQLQVRRFGRVVVRNGALAAAGGIVVLREGELYMVGNSGARIDGSLDAQPGSKIGLVPVVPPAYRRAAAAPGGTLNGELILRPGATLAVSMEGPGACAPLQVTGNAVLAGTLELAFGDGYLPSEGDVCEVLSVDGASTGGFDRVMAGGMGEGFGYRTEASPEGTLSFEALSDATACAGSDCERCDNCVDDNGNGLVDRADPDCTPAPDGAGLGLANEGEAKALLRCHGALRGTSRRLVGQTWKQHQKCADAMLRCHLRKPDDPRCPEKVAAKCAKNGARLAGETGPAAKARAKIAKACTALPLPALREAAGLGHEAAEGACAAVGVPDLDGPEAVARCMTRRQLCQVGALFGTVVPRAAELLGDAGMEGVLPCLAPGSNGAGAGLDDPNGAGKRAAACQKAVGKAAAKLLGRALDTGGRCEEAVLGCLQMQPGDAACLEKARMSCFKQDAALARAEGQLAAVIEKKCGVGNAGPLVTRDDLLAEAGLGFAGAAARCEALGVGPLDSAAAVAECLAAESSCREMMVRQAATPRSEELLRLVAP